MRHLTYIWRISLALLGLGLVSLLLGAGNGSGVAAGDTGAASAPGGLLTFTPTVTPTLTPTPTFPPAFCTAITGSITNSDPVQAGGLNPNGPASVCHVWLSCPGVVDAQPRHYDVYHFVNLTSIYDCITITLDAPTCTGANAVVSAAYYTFNPANICASYQAGTAISPNGSYSFYIPCCGRGSFDLVVAEANPGAGCGSYTLTVGSDITCPTGPTPTPTITNTPTVTPTPTATPTCVTSVLDWRVVSAPSPGDGPMELRGVAAVAAADVWAVGFNTDLSRQLSLIEHWDGQSWSLVPGPTLGIGDNQLNGVTAVAANDVWAVGSYQRSDTQLDTLIEHWDGTTWSVVPSPAIAGASLAAVAAVASYDVWAVGSTDNQTLALHWDGAAWSVVPTPNVGSVGNALLGVEAPAANNVWAVGRYDDRSVHFTYQTLVLHWDGATWSIVPSPNTMYGANILDGVRAVTANDIWAVGQGNGWTLTEHWNGSQWSIVPSPNNGTNDHNLYGVAAPGSGNIWAVGSARNNSAPNRILLENWNGTSWGVAPNPVNGPDDQILLSVVARTATDIWAVGRGTNEVLVLHYAPWPCGSTTPTPPAQTFTATPPATVTGTRTPGGATFTPSPVTPGTGTPTVTGTPTPCLIAFTDVPDGSTFYNYVRCLACAGIVSGYPCGGPGEPCPGLYYRPTTNVTRGQVSKIVAESAGFADLVPSTQQTFQDVPPSSTFHLWIERLVGRGIIGGYPCGGGGEPCVAPGNRPYFRPNNQVTRGQLSKITGGAAAPTATPTGQTFADVPPGSPFYLYVEHMAGAGVVGGYPCGGQGEPCIAPTNRPYFRPNNTATRGQLSKIAASAFFPGCPPAPRR